MSVRVRACECERVNVSVLPGCLALEALGELDPCYGMTLTERVRLGEQEGCQGMESCSRST